MCVCTHTCIQYSIQKLCLEKGQEKKEIKTNELNPVSSGPWCLQGHLRHLDSICSISEC